MKTKNQNRNKKDKYRQNGRKAHQPTQDGRSIFVIERIIQERAEKARAETRRKEREAKNETA